MVSACCAANKNIITDLSSVATVTHTLLNSHVFLLSLMTKEKYTKLRGLSRHVDAERCHRWFKWQMLLVSDDALTNIISFHIICIKSASKYFQVCECLPSSRKTLFPTELNNPTICKCKWTAKTCYIRLTNTFLWIFSNALREGKCPGLTQQSSSFTSTSTSPSFLNLSPFDWLSPAVQKADIIC